MSSFLVTFTFYQIPGSNQHVANVMKNEIERLYHLITQRLIAMLSSKPNGGMHFHAFWLTPPVRMQRRRDPCAATPDDLIITEMQELVTVNLEARIHLFFSSFSRLSTGP
jgi:hypothetical protein